MLKRRVSKLTVVVLFITSLIFSSVYASGWPEDNVSGNWETAVYIDGELFVTRVALDKDGEVAVKLREFMEHLGYSVTWNGENRSVEIKNDKDSIVVFIDAAQCEKNGMRIDLDKPVFIFHDYSYLPQSFLSNVFGIDTVSVDRGEVNNRVDGVYLTTAWNAGEELPQIDAETRQFLFGVWEVETFLGFQMITKDDAEWPDGEKIIGKSIIINDNIFTSKDFGPDYDNYALEIEEPQYTVDSVYTGSEFAGAWKVAESILRLNIDDIVRVIKVEDKNNPESGFMLFSINNERLLISLNSDYFELAKRADHPHMQDLMYLSGVLERNQPHFDKAAFEASVNAVADKLPEMDAAAFNFEIMRLMAEAGDAHTFASLEEREEDKCFPLWQISRFDEGWYILGIKKEYEECVGKEIVAINGVEIDKVNDLARPYISHENETNVEYVFSEEIKNTAFLKHIGVISNENTIPITLRRENSDIYTVEIETFPIGDYEQYTGSWAAFPLTGQYNNGGNYHYAALDDETLFVQYSWCYEKEDCPVSEFQLLLVSELEEHAYQTVIFDLRYNSGGMFSLFEPVVDALGERKKEQGFELYCLIGGTTFSTGLMHAVQIKDFGATLVGRPTRGKPNFYADTEIVTLPNSGIQVSYSTGLVETMPGYEGNSLEPDITVVNKYTLFAEGIDCDVEAVMKLSK